MNPWAWLSFAVATAVFLFVVAGAIVGIIEAERRTRAAERAHDPRCASLHRTKADCDCAALPQISHDELRTAMSAWLTQMMSIDSDTTLFALADMRDWIDNGCSGKMPWPEGD